MLNVLVIVELTYKRERSTMKNIKSTCIRLDYSTLLISLLSWKLTFRVLGAFRFLYFSYYLVFSIFEDADSVLEELTGCKSIQRRTLVYSSIFWLYQSYFNEDWMFIVLFRGQTKYNFLYSYFYHSLSSGNFITSTAVG